MYLYVNIYISHYIPIYPFRNQPTHSRGFPGSDPSEVQPEASPSASLAPQTPVWPKMQSFGVKKKTAGCCHGFFEVTEVCQLL